MNVFSYIAASDKKNFFKLFLMKYLLALVFSSAVIAWPFSSQHSCFKLVDETVAYAKSVDAVGQFKYVKVADFIKKNLVARLTKSAPQDYCQGVELELSGDESAKGVVNNGKIISAIWEDIFEKSSDRVAVLGIESQEKHESILISLIPTNAVKQESTVGVHRDDAIKAMHALAVKENKLVYKKFNGVLIVVSPNDKTSTETERDAIYERYKKLSNLPHTMEHYQLGEVKDVARKVKELLKSSIGLFDTPRTSKVRSLFSSHSNPLFAAVEEITNETDAVTFTAAGLKKQAFKPHFLENLQFSAEREYSSHILKKMWMNIVAEFKAKA